MEEKKEGHTHAEHEHHKSNSKTFKLNLENAFVVLAIILLVILLINLYLTFTLNQDLKKNAESLKEKSKPANIQLSVIKNSKCSDCFDIDPVINYIKTQKVNVTSEKILEFDSTEGKQLISDYKIEKIPTVIVTGETGKFAIQGLEKKGNAIVLKTVNPPYSNATNGKIFGRVTLYRIYDPTCEKCNDMSFLINQFKLFIDIIEQKNITSSSNEGKNLISKYKLSFVPVIILSKDAGAYDIIKKAWSQIGKVESDGSYVLSLVYPPFINLTTNELKGVVNVIYLADKECTECYNVNLHRSILTSPSSFGMKLDKEETIDISDAKGKELLLKYNITQVPTIILSRGVTDYPSSIGLKQFFSMEKDGSYIFRKLSVVGTYKDLATNTVVKPQTNQGQQAQT